MRMNPDILHVASLPNPHEFGILLGTDIGPDRKPNDCAMSAMLKEKMMRRYAIDRRCLVRAIIIAMVEDATKDTNAEHIWGIAVALKGTMDREEG